MDEEAAARVVAKTLQWVVRQAEMPAIKDVVHNDGNELFFTDSFTGDKFRVIVMATD